MQTFLPYLDFTKSASVLDSKRLGKQRVEAKQIYLALTEPTYGWKNHPAVKMWRGYEISLLIYLRIVCREWQSRGYKDTVLAWSDEVIYNNFADLFGKDSSTPNWLCGAFCLSHQSNLVRKDPAHYRKFFPDVPDNLPYIWPVK